MRYIMIMMMNDKETMSPAEEAITKRNNRLSIRAELMAAVTVEELKAIRAHAKNIELTERGANMIYDLYTARCVLADCGMLVRSQG